MFTGLIEEVGTVMRIDGTAHGSRLTVQGERVVDSVREGDSICVDGVCLTATEVGRDRFVSDVSPETISRSNQAYYQIGTAVNLERPLPVGARLGGHFVQGHVDATTRVVGEREEGDFLWMSFRLPEGLSPYVVEKGSVAVNGVSLTVARLGEEEFEVQLVPQTLQRTNLTAERRAEVVNLEVDVLGKYVARLLRRGFGSLAGGSADGDDDSPILRPEALIEVAGERSDARTTRPGAAPGAESPEGEEPQMTGRDGTQP